MTQDLIQKIIKEKSESSWWRKSEEKVVGKYGKIFHPQNLNQLTKEDFQSFLLFKNNLHWWGIHRQQKLITSNMSKLKRVLGMLLNESKPIEERLDCLSPKNRGKNIKGLGKAVVTPILLIVYPKKYGVWNQASETALKKLGLFPEFQRDSSFGEKYHQVSKVLNKLKSDYSISLWQLDGILGEIIDRSPFRAAVRRKIYNRSRKKKLKRSIRFCKYCGKRIDSDSIYCRFCGKKITPRIRQKTGSGKSSFNSRKKLLEYAEFVNKNYRSGDKAFLFYQKVIGFHKKYGDIKKLLRNDDFLKTIHETLKAWNMNQRGARLKSLFEIKKSILNLEDDISWLSDYELDSLKEIELKKILNKLEKVFVTLRPMKSKTQIVGASKLLHFLLPNLVMPIDRKYTLSFLSPNHNYWKDIKEEFDEFKKVFIIFYRYAKKFNLTAKDTEERTWNASVPKIIDNAIIGIQKI